MRGVSDCFLCLCDLTGLSSYSVKTFEAAGAHVSDPNFCDRDNLPEVFHICPAFR